MIPEHYSRDIAQRCQSLIHHLRPLVQRGLADDARFGGPLGTTFLLALATPMIIPPIERIFEPANLAPLRPAMTGISTPRWPGSSVTRSVPGALSGRLPSSLPAGCVLTKTPPDPCARRRHFICTVENLLKPENRDQLVALLTYRVVPGKTMSSDPAGQEVEVETVEGSPVSIDATEGAVKVAEATVVQPDLEADNGAIHVIDPVIMPAIWTGVGRGGSGPRGARGSPRFKA